MNYRDALALPDPVSSEMAEYAVAHYKRVSEEGGGGDAGPADDKASAHLTTEGILRRIHYYR